MRKIHDQHEIPTELFLQICDLGLSDYEEAVKLFPTLLNFKKEHIDELIEEVKLSTTYWYWNLNTTIIELKFLNDQLKAY